MIRLIQILFWLTAALYLAGGLLPLVLRNTRGTGGSLAGRLFLSAAAAAGLLLFILRAILLGRLPISGGADFKGLLSLKQGKARSPSLGSGGTSSASATSKGRSSPSSRRSVEISAATPIRQSKALPKNRPCASSK